MIRKDQSASTEAHTSWRRKNLGFDTTDDSRFFRDSNDRPYVMSTGHCQTDNRRGLPATLARPSDRPKTNRHTIKRSDLIESVSHHDERTRSYRTGVSNQSLPFCLCSWMIIFRAIPCFRKEGPRNLLKINKKEYYRGRYGRTKLKLIFGDNTRIGGESSIFGILHHPLFLKG
jgi:hypothetical protein